MITNRVLREALRSANAYHAASITVLHAAGFTLSTDRRGLNNYELLYTHRIGHEFILDTRKDKGGGYLYSGVGPIDVEKDKLRLHLRPYLPRTRGRGRKD